MSLKYSTGYFPSTGSNCNQILYRRDASCVVRIFSATTLLVLRTVLLVYCELAHYTKRKVHFATEMRDSKRARFKVYSCKQFCTTCTRSTHVGSFTHAPHAPVYEITVYTAHVRCTGDFTYSIQLTCRVHLQCTMHVHGAPLSSFTAKLCTYYVHCRCNFHRLVHLQWTYSLHCTSRVHHEMHFHCTLHLPSTRKVYTARA